MNLPWEEMNCTLFHNSRCFWKTLNKDKAMNEYLLEVEECSCLEKEVHQNAKSLWGSVSVCSLILNVSSDKKSLKTMVKKGLFKCRFHCRLTRKKKESKVINEDNALVGGLPNWVCPPPKCHFGCGNKTSAHSSLILLAMCAFRHWLPWAKMNACECRNKQLS